MKIFKHEGKLVIEIPEDIKTKLGLVENTELEFLEIEPGLIALTTPEYIASSVKDSMVSKLIAKLAAKTTPTTNSLPTTANKTPAASASTLVKIKQNGIMIIQNEFQARKMAEELSMDLKKGEIIGAHVDKKFYFLSKQYYEIYSARVKSAIGKDSKVDEIVEKSKSSLDTVLAVISILKEQGELLEKTKGKYTLI